MIRYSSGGIERVNGGGVIGETPIFTPGHVHRYASCTRFNNEDYCTMEGHYLMKYLRKGELCLSMILYNYCSTRVCYRGRE